MPRGPLIRSSPNIHTALDVAIPLMLEDASTGLDPGGIGTLLTLASFFYLFGKVSMGYGVDRCGARFVFLWLASFVSAGLTYLMSASATPASMTVIMCALCIAQSSGAYGAVPFVVCVSSKQATHVIASSSIPSPHLNTTHSHHNAKAGPP